MWQKINSFLEILKKNPVLKFIYKIPFLAKFYHFSLAFLGALLYGFPSKKIFVIGVTGTKGKTTTLGLMESVLRTAGKNIAVLSSAGVKIADKDEGKPVDNTMPGRFFIQKFLSDAIKAKCEYALIEATSQGAVNYRHRFIRWSTAFLTNLAPEHIEAHGSFENYRDAKLSFLAYAAKTGAKIFLNQRDSGSEYFFQKLPSENTTFFSAELLPELPAHITEILPGDFNKDNIAAAFALGDYIGLQREEILRGIASFRGVPGRFEFIVREPFVVVIDYAHTPDSLEAIYGAVKPDAPGKLICVLGAAGGGRDKWKRPVFGKIAADYCDKIILTDEDPYDEDPEEILKEIEAGITKQKNISKKLDRGEAIREAVSSASAGDVVIITGKGNEKWIHKKNGEKISWSDKMEAEKALGVNR